MKISKFALSCAALLALALPLSSARATELADWTFENIAHVGLSNSTDYSYGPSDTGIGLTGGGHHASSSTDWAYVNGTGGAGTRGLNSNTWAIGDYWEFSLSTTGFENIKVAFDTGSSAAGPRDFKLAYSTNGTTFTDFATYTVTSTSYVNKAFDLSAITALDNAPTVFFRLIDTSTVASNGTGVVDPAGTNKIDNFIVTGDALVPVPEPSTVIGGFLAAGILFWHQRRRLSRWVGLRATA